MSGSVHASCLDLSDCMLFRSVLCCVAAASALTATQGAWGAALWRECPLCCLTAGGYHRMRDHVVARLGLTAPPDTQCRALLVTRHEPQRMVMNANAVMAVLQRILGSSCQVTQAAFDGTPAEQVALAAKATFMVSVSGTGAHQAMWLPDGECVHHGAQTACACRRAQQLRGHCAPSATPLAPWRPCAKELIWL